MSINTSHSLPDLNRHSYFASLPMAFESMEQMFCSPVSNPPVCSTYGMLSLCIGTIFISALLTHILSRILGRSRKVSFSGTDVLTVPLQPYWFLKLGHIPTLPFQAESLLRSAKASSPHGVFALNFWGTTHNMVYAPSIIQNIFSQRDSVANFPNNLTFWFLNTVGGIPSRFRPSYEQLMGPLHHPVTNNLLREPALSKILGVAIRNFEAKIPVLVSLAKDQKDLSPWERSGAAKHSSTRNGQPAVEVELMRLITDFVGLQALPSIFGTDLFDNFPNILANLWDFNAGFLLLGVLPAWVPIPLLSKARAGRAAVTRALGELHYALDLRAAGCDPGSAWRNLDSVSEIILGRNKIYREGGIPCDVRADLAILWALNANSNFLVFWMLLRILDCPGMVNKIREEIDPFVNISFSAGDEDVMKIDERSIAKSCVLLKACFIETLRLDSAPWAIKQVQQNIIVTDIPPTSTAKISVPASSTIAEQPKVTAASASYLLRAGEFVDVPCNLHFMDPAYFPSPHSWDPYRFIDATPTLEDPGKRVVNWRTVRPYGGGATMCKGRLYAEKEVMSCVAGMLAYWNFEPVTERWPNPRKKKTPGVYFPKDKVVVRLMKRQTA